MAALRRVVAVLLLSCAVPARADKTEQWRPYMEEASVRFGIPLSWITRVMNRESGGALTLAGRPIVSPAGAMGLMQLMPGTWRAMRTQLALGSNPHEPRDNILAGTLYLRLMYDRFGYPGLFAAYNAGPARYADHLRLGRALPAETQAYVRALGGGNSLPGVQPERKLPSGIFFALRSVPVEDAPVPAGKSDWEAGTLQPSSNGR